MAVHARPVLMLTHDDLLWQHWKKVSVTAWLPARGRAWEDLLRWQAQGRRLAVIDLDLPGMPAINTEGWLALANNMDLLVASTKVSDEQGQRYLAAGAKGYVHAYVTTEGLETALQVLANGGVWMGASLLSRLLSQLDRNRANQASNTSGERTVGDGGRPDWATGLTPREHEVAIRAARGMSNQAIADELGITERTVRAHISAVFEKLGISDRLMLALLVNGIAS